MTVKLGQSSTPPNTRIYAIGDIHGYLNLLENLHRQIRQDLQKHPVKHHKIIFLGDYIDRGPDSAGCVNYLINLLAENPNVICLKGNHEDKLEKFLPHPLTVADSFFVFGGAECATSYGVDMDGYGGSNEEALEKCAELTEKIPASHKAFFAALTKTVTFGDYLFTHAGVRPGVPLNKQSDHDLMWIRPEFMQHEGLYDKVIVHGHTPVFPIEILPNRINTDTHAYDTGVLSCIVLEGTDYRVIEACLSQAN